MSCIDLPNSHVQITKLTCAKPKTPNVPPPKIISSNLQLSLSPLMKYHLSKHLLHTSPIESSANVIVSARMWTTSHHLHCCHCGPSHHHLLISCLDFYSNFLNSFPIFALALQSLHISAARVILLKREGMSGFLSLSTMEILGSIIFCYGGLSSVL